MSAENRSGAGEALRLSSLTKVYDGVSSPVVALRDVSLSLSSGTFTAVMGPSGSGKSTLLQCAAGLDQPTEGRVFVAGDAMPRGSEAEVTTFRRTRIGFVFQQYNLIPYLTVSQNVLLPQRLAGRRVDRDGCAAVLARLGIADLADRRPGELSGGQQQRVAIAVAAEGGILSSLGFAVLAPAILTAATSLLGRLVAGLGGAPGQPGVLGIRLARPTGVDPPDADRGFHRDRHRHAVYAVDLEFGPPKRIDRRQER